MFYDINSALQEQLLHLPETGMGYQVFTGFQEGDYVQRKFVALNAKLAFRAVNENDFIFLRHQPLLERIEIIAARSPYLNLTNISNIHILQEANKVGYANERSTAKTGAIHQRREFTDGTETFVRLSAYQNDRRIDKVNNCLLPGSFTTTIDDYLLCKSRGLNPVSRYALPNDETIKWAFYIMPTKADPLQRGIVEPANGHIGGGKEIYFENGTSKNTFLKETVY
ncbi:hypothetical protein [Adhaeribacter soli]|uniref:Uncharacterized protein n=1 Tax=Adhaeribacter soli TaxID=2607655 RepID=A0A5N1J150_9BACT|nr:hypothetical protein [Adhaeribacter soli]KAA9338809.1 hypothetical protein F0P94_08415 [Adhaeribacter soli]